MSIAMGCGDNSAQAQIVADGLRATAPRRVTSASADAGESMRILQAQCFACHNPGKHRGGLDLTSRESVLKGGDGGKAVVPRKPGKSLLLSMLGPDAEPHMPPRKQLTTNEILTLHRWVASGAAWDAATLARLAAPREVTFESPPTAYHPVLALAADPEARRVAFGRGSRLVIQDLSATNRPVLVEVEAHRDAVRSVAWSPDGRWVASGGFRELTVWDAGSLQPLWSVRSNLTGRVTALRFSPHGGALVVAEGGPADPGWVRLFGADNGRALGAWVAHGDSILDLAISADGGVLATAGGDKLVKTWELVSQREIARFEGHVGAVLGVAFNPAATELVSVGADKQLKLWDARTHEAVVTMGGRRHGFSSVAWSTDGSRVVAGDEGGFLWSFAGFKRHSGEQSSATADERQLGSWGEPVHAVAASADGKTLFCGTADGVVRVVNAEGKLLVEAPASTAETTASNPPEAPSFVYDILPALAKAGCSAGACHAKADGQNGFKLSVFSYDPRSDYVEVTKEGRGRRVFPAAPDESLLLLKPLAAVEHGGGRRIEPGGEVQALLRRWIRAGMPYQRTNEPSLVGIEVEPKEGLYRKSATQQLAVKARYSDGSMRDVTALTEYLSNEKERVQVDDRGGLKIGQLSGESVVVARFSGLVAASRVAVPADHLLPPEKYEALPANNFIDRLAYVQFRKLGLYPSDLCTDAEFLRRASLDTIGVLPTPGEVREFLGLGKDGAGVAGPTDADAVRARRAALVERLLARPEWADYWANKWADLLRPNPDRVGVKSVFVLDQWLRDAFRSGLSYDRFAREILLAEGSNHREGPIVVYRDRRDPPELTTLFSQLFLGVRMECAKCHHHPNEKWSQDDFYQFAAVFGALKQKGAGLSPPISAGTESFYFASGGGVRHPVSGAEMRPRPPDGPDLVGSGPADPRHAFADWLTAPGNPFFARAAVNRVWAVFFGRGIVEPVDDFRVSNPASDEALLSALAEDFAAHGHDLKHLMRAILGSRLYQLSSTPNESNLADTRNFSRSYRRRLPAEVLLDAVNDITGVGDEFNGCPPGTRAMQTWSYKIGSQFLDAFGRPNSSSDCPCERDLRTSVVQALHLMNSRRLHEKLADGTGRVRKLADSERSPAQIITELYLTTLGRLPSAEESAAATAGYGSASTPEARRGVTEDVLWALLNSAEFVFNH